jgi:hypothetical protein
MEFTFSNRNSFFIYFPQLKNNFLQSFIEEQNTYIKVELGIISWVEYIYWSRSKLKMRTVTSSLQLFLAFNNIWMKDTK